LESLRIFSDLAVGETAAIGVPRDDDPDNEFVKAFVVIKEGESVTGMKSNFSKSIR